MSGTASSGGDDDGAACAVATVPAATLVHTLLSATARACEIAVVIRLAPEFEQVVVRKPNRRKGSVTTVDFVSTADLLIQRVLQDDLANAIPALDGHVMGEEDLGFREHGDGDTVPIETIPRDVPQLKSLLRQIFPIGFETITDRIAEVLARPLDSFAVTFETSDIAGNYVSDDLAVWVDPLDSTTSYVKGRMPTEGRPVEAESGALPTATVLVGAFSIGTGKPLIGVVGQPFSSFISGEWQSRMFWGIADTADDGQAYTGVFPDANEIDIAHRPKSFLVARSSSEPPEVVHAIEEKLGPGSTLAVAGAGFKLLSLIRGLTSAYYVGLPTTYAWDTCGPHAIILALGGNVVDSKTGQPITYSIDNRLPHKDGVVASLSDNLIEQLVESTAPLRLK